MRKIFLLMLAVVMVLSVTACSDNAPPAEINDSSNVMSIPTTQSTAEPSEATGLSTDESVDTPTDSAELPRIEDSFPGEVLYEGIPVSLFFQATIDEVVGVLGIPADNNEYTCIYDDISFYRDEEGKVTSVESFNLEAFTLDGNALDKDRTGLISIIGNPSSEGDGGSGHEITFYQEKYTLKIATGDYESVAWRIFVYPDLSETWARKKVESWLENTKFPNPVTISGVDYTEEEIDEDYHSYELSEDYGNSVNYITRVCINRKTGEMFSSSGYGEFTPLDEWYYAKYINDNSGNSNQSGKPVSADGYIISSGATIYVKGGGWSMMGSLTEGVINFKADGGYSITWVAVLENMGINGWQRSKIYKDGLVTKFYSPTTKQSLMFYSPSNVSLDKLYINP